MTDSAWIPLAAALTIVAFTAGLALLAFVGTWIVGPMDQAARNVRAPTQFFVIDLIGLALLLQVATLLPAWVVRNAPTQTQMALTIGGLVWGATAVIWWASIGSMSRAGVRKTAKRFVFSVVVLPLALACIIGSVGVTFALIVSIGYAFDSPRGWMYPLLLAGADVLILVLAFAGRLATLWVLSQPTTHYADNAPSKSPL